MSEFLFKAGNALLISSETNLNNIPLLLILNLKLGNVGYIARSSHLYQLFTVIV